jgi:hypothetical protein
MRLQHIVLHLRLRLELQMVLKSVVSVLKINAVVVPHTAVMIAATKQNIQQQATLLDHQQMSLPNMPSIPCT